MGRETRFLPDVVAGRKYDSRIQALAAEAEQIAGEIGKFLPGELIHQH